MTTKKTIAIADVHGRSDLLEAVHRFIADYASVDASEPEIIYLGDICDHGPQSKKCFNLVKRTLENFANSTLIRGNHDNWFLKAVRYGDGRAAMNWINQGGVQTLASYYVGALKDAIEIVDEFHEDHLDLVENASTYMVRGNVCFTHAGIKPGVAIAEQDEYDLMWIRDEFLSHVGHLEKVVVHGHSAVEGGLPEVTENRISLDTDAYQTGRLSFLVIDWEERSVKFFQTDGNADAVVEVEPVKLNRGLGLATDHIWRSWGVKNVA